MRVASSVILAMLLAAPLQAQTGGGGLAAKDIPQIDKKPLDWEIGPEAVVVKGIGILAGTSAEPERWTGYAQYSVNGEYGDAGKNRIADIDVTPGFTRAWLIRNPEPPGCPEAFPQVPGGSASVYATVRNRYADIDKTAAVNYQNTAMGGVGAKLRVYPPFLLRWTGITGKDVDMPTFSATYYNAFSEDSPNPNITADQIQLAFRAEVPVPFTVNRKELKTFKEARTEWLKRAQCDANFDFDANPPPKRPEFPVNLSVELKASRPTSGDDNDDTEFFADVALTWLQPNSKVGLAVRYRSGQDLGFEYDRQYLAGVLVRLFDQDE